jgi:4-diphosphocytidyl-2-C-methyl-D-erythritol kinase
MILFPPCKINLGLKVVEKRSDGYHNLETIMFQLPVNDVLELVKSDVFSFKSSGIPIPGSQENNLCIKAFELLKNRHSIGNVQIHLMKNIPMGGGLGGGSSNGTYTLLALNELFELNLSKDVLRSYAAELGSDCPLFVETFPQFAEGRGELLSPISINLSGYYLRLINIGIHISTKEAFSSCRFPSKEKPLLQDIIQQKIENWKGNLHNDFEDSVFPLYPALANLKEKLYEDGAIYASMTGSGSTLYAIYTQKPELLHLENGVFEKIVEL